MLAAWTLVIKFAFPVAYALWRGEPVDWDGRWQLKDAVLGPTPHRPGGPAIWGGGSVEAALKRAGRYYDGWFPTGPDAVRWGDNVLRTVEVMKSYYKSVIYVAALRPQSPIIAPIDADVLNE